MLWDINYLARCDDWFRPILELVMGGEMLRMVLLIFAFVLFLVAAAGISYPKVNFGWLGLAFLTAAEFVPSVMH